MKKLIILISFCLLALTWKAMGLETGLKKDAGVLLSEKLKAYSLYNKQIQQNNRHLTRSLMLKPGMQPMLSALEMEKTIPLISLAPNHIEKMPD